MRDYSYREKWQKLLTPDIVGLLTKIHEYKGEQNKFVEAKKDTLISLVEIAKIQSTEASNRIEGIYTSDERIRQLVLDKTTPRNRNEHEIAGYRDVLKTIHESYEYIPIKPTFILQLHRDLYKFSGQGAGGSFKVSDNVIAEERENGEKFVRFTPVPAWETAPSVENFCKAYDDAINEGQADELLLIPMFILDFLCIHPFRDGNGRMSRLLTLLALYRAGFVVGKYISIEKIIESTKETYYETLQQSSYGWAENKNDYAPFVKYMLGVVVSAYREFAERVQSVEENKFTKPQKIENFIKNKLGKISKTEIMQNFPDISQITVQRALNDLLNSRKIQKIGGGRYTYYVWNGDK